MLQTIRMMLLSAITLISLQSFASGELAAKADLQKSSNQNWNVELSGFFRSHGSPVFGPSFSYSPTPRNSFGLRTLMAASAKENHDDYRTSLQQLFWRHDFSERSTHAFLQTNGGVEKARGYALGFGARSGVEVFYNASVELGVLHCLQEQICFGGTTGLSIPNLQTTQLAVDPQISVLTGYRF